MDRALIAPVLAGLLVGLGLIMLFGLMFPFSMIDGQVDNQPQPAGKRYNVTIVEEIKLEDQLSTGTIRIDEGVFYTLAGAIAGAIISPSLVHVFRYVSAKRANDRIRRMISLELNEYRKNLRSISKTLEDKGSGEIILTPANDSLWEPARQAVEYGIRYYADLTIEKKADVFSNKDLLDRLERIYRSARFLITKLSMNYSEENRGTKCGSYAFQKRIWIHF